MVQEAGWATGPVWTGAENLAPAGIQSPDRPVRSQSLYRLSYSAHHSPVPRIYSLVRCTMGPLMAAIPLRQASVIHKDRNSMRLNGQTRLSQWPRAVLRRGCAAARLLGLRVRIPPYSWISVSCMFCALQGRGLCIGLITCSWDACRVLCFWVWSRNLNSGRSRHSMAVEAWKKNGHTRHFLAQVCSNAAYMWSTVEDVP